ncbi:family 43 glycosylhydrolase [Halosimplex aquaticum]
MRGSPRVWDPNLDDDQYQNPIIYADYSDPDVVRVGDDYFMTASSFNAVPALPILHSRDLVNWRLVNHAIDELPPPSTARSTATASGRPRSTTTTGRSTSSTATPIGAST